MLRDPSRTSGKKFAHPIRTLEVTFFAASFHALSVAHQTAILIVELFLVVLEGSRRVIVRHAFFDALGANAVMLFCLERLVALGALKFDKDFMLRHAKPPLYLFPGASRQMKSPLSSTMAGSSPLHSHSRPTRRSATGRQKFLTMPLGTWLSSSAPSSPNCDKTHFASCDVQRCVRNPITCFEILM